MQNLSQLIENHFLKKSNKYCEVHNIIQKELISEAPSYDEVAGQEIRKGRMPVNMGSTAEGIFALGLIASMKKGTPIVEDDILDNIEELYEAYLSVAEEERQIIDVVLNDVKNFQSHFSPGVKVNVRLKIALNPADMATLFMPLLNALPPEPGELNSNHEKLFRHLLNLKSGNQDGWARLAAILLNETVPHEEKQKALLLLKGKYDPIVKEYHQVLGSVSSFWNQKGGGKRGYEDVVTDTLGQPDPDNLSKKLKDTGATVSVVADGISANLATTADAFVKIGDQESGTMLFSYSLKKGSNQIFQTGSPGSDRQLKKGVGGGIEYMFLKFGLSQDAIPPEVMKFYNCVDNIYSKPQSIQGDECGAVPSKHSARDPEAIRTHLNVWSAATKGFSSAIGEKLANDEAYRTEMLGGLAIMITKTKKEIDMEYVNLGTSAKNTIRAFPGLIAKYAKHFEFSAGLEDGRVLEEYGEFTASQPTVYTAVSQPIKRENLCIVATEGECPEDQYEVKVSEIKNLLARGADYLIDFFDADSADKIFEFKPGMREEFDSIVEKYTGKSISPETHAQAKRSAFDQLIHKNFDSEAISELINRFLSEDDILDMVVKKLNFMLPKAGEKVFFIRIKTRITSKGRHDWRTIMEKSHGMSAIMDFVKYAKYLKYEAGDAVLEEVENILEASVKALAAAEEKLKLRQQLKDEE